MWALYLQVIICIVNYRVAFLRISYFLPEEIELIDSKIHERQVGDSFLTHMECTKAIAMYQMDLTLDTM